MKIANMKHDQNDMEMMAQSKTNNNVYNEMSRHFTLIQI